MRASANGCAPELSVCRLLGLAPQQETRGVYVTPIEAGSRGSKPREVPDDRYRIEKELGRGGIGVVYKALDLADHIRVAIKMLLER